MTESSGGPEREILTWSDYGVGIRELASQIAGDGFQPDMILGIASDESNSQIHPGHSPSQWH